MPKRSVAWGRELQHLMDIEGEEPLFTSISDLKALLNSPGWEDVSRVMYGTIMAIRDDLELMGEGRDRNEMSHAQGEIYALRVILDLPNIMIENLEADAKEQEDE